MPLTMAKSGELVRFVAVRASQELKRRLAALGLIPGSQLRVISHSLKGPFIISIKGSRIMLGRGTAQKIMVE